MLAMHEGLNIQQIADAFNLSGVELRDEVQPLIEASLVQMKNGRYVPSVLVADAEEAQKVYENSRELGLTLASSLIAEWDTLEDAFSILSISDSTSLKEQGFMLVGSRILDIGVLEELALDRSLLRPAPSRPSPDRPNARFYFWVVEGDPVYLGKYGQDDTTLRWPEWHVLNFGQTIIDGELNQARRDFEDRIKAVVDSESTADPVEIAEELEIYFMDENESETWHKITKEISGKLHKILLDNKSDIEDFYQTLKASQYSEDSFGEFYCWYYHLVYVWAIDALAESEMIEVPADRFSGIVLHREGPEAILVS